MTGVDADIVVIGAGPAGTAIATRLARLGHDVLIVEAASFPRPRVGESLHMGILPLLEELGVCDEILDAGFLRTSEAIVRWGGETRIRTDLAHGLQVDRAQFDLILLGASIRAGVRIAQPARVAQFRSLGREAWKLTAIEHGMAREISCRFVIDAAGRRGCLPCCARRRLQPSTLAIFAYWHGTKLSSEGTRVEAGSDRWYWTAHLPDDTVNATVFVDPISLKKTRGIGLRNAYFRLLRDSQLSAGCLSGTLATQVRACSATATRVGEPIGEDWIKIGEAAIAMDPLSSQGVQNAIVSGLQGASIVNSMLSHPESRTAAMTFCRERLAETSETHIARAAEFYRQQATVTPSPFWIARASHSEQGSSTAARRLTQLEPNMMLQLNPLATWLQTPSLLNDIIIWRSALHLPGHRPIVWLEGETLSDLIHHQFGQLIARDLLAFWSASLGPNRAARILDWLYHRRFLVPSDHQDCESPGL